MSANEPTAAEKCTAITEAAIRTAQDRCADDDVLREQLARLLGMDGEPDANCTAALSEGLDAQTLASPLGTRQWVFCRAWELVRDDQVETLSQGLNRAWAEVSAAEDGGA